MSDKADYTPEIKAALEECLREHWMSDADWAAVVEESFARIGHSYQSFSDAVHEGITQGYSPETQFALLRAMLTKAKNG